MTSEIKGEIVLRAELYPAANKVVPILAFNEIKYGTMVNDLEIHFHEIKDFMTTPAVVSYDELATLRRRAVSPDLGTNRYQSQIHLAVDLLRLGRRNEGLNLLKEQEQRLLEWQNVERSRCYLLWIALVTAAIGNAQAAFFLSLQVAESDKDSFASDQVVSFFRSIHSPQSAIVR